MDWEPAVERVRIEQVTAYPPRVIIADIVDDQFKRGYVCDVDERVTTNFVSSIHSNVD